MRNSAFVEVTTGAAKAERFIKSDSGQLRMQVNAFDAPTLGGAKGALQQFAPNPPSSRGFEDRHAPDFRHAAPHDQARGADRPVAEISLNMERPAVVAIELDVRGNALFGYENTQTDIESLLQLFFGRNLPHPNAGIRNPK